MCFLAILLIIHYYMYCLFFHLVKKTDEGRKGKNNNLIHKKIEDNENIVIKISLQ